MNLRLYSETTLDDTERKFRDISDPLIREDILCSLVKNITRSKNIVPRTSSTKLSQADLDILDVYFKNRSTSDDPRQWLATRIFQLYEPSSDLFDRSLIFSVTSEQTESILKGGTVAPPILSIAAEKERKKQAVDLYLERFMAYLLYFEETYARSSNTSQGRIERLRSQIEEKFGYIQSVKQQFISRITTLRENKKASDLVEYLRAISLRRADDPITGFIRSIIRESGLPIPRESSNGDWEYFGATVSSKTLPLYTSFLFSKNQGMYLDFHLEISPPFPIQFTENSVFWAKLSLPRAGNTVSYFWESIPTPPEFRDTSGSYARLTGGHGLRIVGRSTGKPPLGISLSPHGPLYGGFLENAALWHDTYISGGLMLATLYQSCIGANFMAPKVGYPNPAIGAKFDGSSGRNSYWQVPPTHIIASGNSLKGALLTAGIQGSHFEEDAGEKIVIVGSDERSTRVLSRIEWASLKWATILGEHTANEWRFDGTQKEKNGPGEDILIFSHTERTQFRGRVGMWGYVLGGPTQALYPEEHPPHLAKQESRTYTISGKAIEPDIASSLRTRLEQRIDTQINEAIRHYSQDQSIFEKVTLQKIGCLGLRQSIVDWDRFVLEVLSISDISKKTIYLNGIEKVLGRIPAIIDLNLQKGVLVKLGELISRPGELEGTTMNESEEEKQRIRIFRKRIEKREFWTTATGFQKDLFQTHVADLWSTQAESTLRMLNWSSVPGLPEKHALAIHDQIIRTLAVIAQNHTALSRSKESHTRLITELYYARFLLEQLR